MAERPLLFDLFRLNIVDAPDVFDFMGKPIRLDTDILSVISAAAGGAFTLPTESGRFGFDWNLLEFLRFEPDNELKALVVSVTLARSTRTQVGQTVSARRIEDSVSEMSPPPADTIRIFFYMERHLVVVEYSSTLMRSQLWKLSLHHILDAASRELGFRSDLRLEPVPRKEEILEVFRSFDILTRLRVKLRIPNPELDRLTERLRQEMERARIREYTQDMRNPNGLSTEPEALPFASAVMAQAGYKDGEVILAGVRGGRRVVVKTGNQATRGRLEGLKDFVRGIGANTRTKEGTSVIASILREVDRLIERPDAVNGDEGTVGPQ